MNAPIFLFPALIKAAAPEAAARTHEPLQAGDRWITVHPWGDSVPGVPVLIREHPTKKGIFHIVGGAGGKLNYLTLRNVKAPGTYKEDAQKRVAAEKAERQRLHERDRAAGLVKPKAEARAELLNRRTEARHAFIAAVAQVAGWTPDQTEFPGDKYTHLTEKAYRTLQHQWERKLVVRAHDYVDQQRQILIASEDARRGLMAHVAPSLANDPDRLTVSDLDPVRETSSGMGFNPHYTARAVAHAGGEEALQQDIDLIAPKKEESAEARTKKQSEAENLKAELASATLPPPPTLTRTALDDAAATAGLLIAEKKFRQAEHQVKTALRDIDKAATLDDIPATDANLASLDPGQALAQVQQSLREQLQTVQARALLSAVGKVTEDQPIEAVLGSHLLDGADSVASACALTLTGTSLIDRSVIDVLGITGAARVIAETLHQTLDPTELKNAQTALGEWHAEHSAQTATQALDEAQAWLDQAERITAAPEAETGALESGTGTDLLALQALNHQRLDALGEARRLLGTALGANEMGAALAYWLSRPPGEDYDLPMPSGMTAADVVTRLHAIGLDPADYTLTPIGTQPVVTLKAAALAKLAQDTDSNILYAQRATMDIISGRRDDPDWLPAGFARRPDLVGVPREGIVQKLAEPWTATGDLTHDLKSYLGGRMADGDNPVDMMADLLTNDFLARTGDREKFLATLNDLLPPTRTRVGVVDGETKERTERVPIEEYRPVLEQWADEFVQERYGTTRNSLARQDIPMDDTAVEAMHRTLAANPDALAAYKPIGELTPQDERTLRLFFKRHIARDTGRAEQLQTDIQRLKSQEPPRQTEDMWGEMSENPDWQAWHQRLTDQQNALQEARLTWSQYTTVMDGREHAYAAIQDLIRSRASLEFAHTYNVLRPDTPLRIGRQNIRHSLRHLGALDPAERQARLAELASETAKLRRRHGGKFAEGSVGAEREARRQHQEGFKEAEMGLLDTATESEKPLANDERYTLGHVAEQRLAGLADLVGSNFKPDQPVKLWNASMGDRYINQQRAIRLIGQNKRVALALGVGSGKTAISLGAFTQLHAEGKAHRGLFLTPSATQNQFGAEALRFLQPNTYHWHCAPAAGREERIAAYKDPSHHFVVATHQAFRNDLLHLAAQRDGTRPATVAKQLKGMSPENRATWMKKLLEDTGVKFDFSMVDEGHNLLNRASKENSGMANVIDAVTAQTPYYVSATADPVKNDPSEIFDLLHKMDEHRYHNRDAFMRRYGGNVLSHAEGLRRELVQHLYPGRIDPGVAAEHRQQPVTLTSGQTQKLKALDGAIARLRIARATGDVDVAAAKEIAPHLFEGAPDEKHAKIAQEVGSYVGVLKNAAARRIIDVDPQGAKVRDALKLIDERKGKPGILFVHRLEAAKVMAEQLKAKGYRVAEMIGAQDARKKDEVRRAFSPEAGQDPTVDVLVSTDAGACGINCQRGQWVIQYDTPDTAMVHEQRNGRIFRLGQTQNVELIDLVADHPLEHAALRRLTHKYQLRTLMTSPYEELDDSGLGAYLHHKATVQAEAAEDRATLGASA